jgi:carotenoid 1,2-hydratase
VSVNAVLYGNAGGRWAMTERGATALAVAPDSLRIGSSALSVGAQTVEIDIDEVSVPLPRPLRGRITIETGPVFDDVYTLDRDGRHVWRPVAPFARVHVAFSRPAVHWSGSAYLDLNRGEEPAEAGFRSWTWSRAKGPEDTTIFYDVEGRRGDRRGLALSLRRDGIGTTASAPPHVALPSTLWRVGRTVRTEAPPREVRTFEDTPFYTRTAATTTIGGVARPTICESVDLDRFASPWVQALLPFRMPRFAR